MLNWFLPIVWPPPDLGEKGERIFTEVVEKLTGIPYVVCFGTALGIHRDGTLIPSDSDIDIAIQPAAVPAVQKAFADWPLALSRTENSGRIRQLIWYPTGVIVDFNVFVPVPEGYAYERYRLSPNGFSQDWRDTPYGMVPLPGDVEPLLETLYGDWRTPRHRGKPV